MELESKNHISELTQDTICENPEEEEYSPEKSPNRNTPGRFSDGIKHQESDSQK